MKALLIILGGLVGLGGLILLIVSPFFLAFVLFGAFLVYKGIKYQPDSDDSGLKVFHQAESEVVVDQDEPVQRNYTDGSFSLAMTDAYQPVLVKLLKKPNPEYDVAGDNMKTDKALMFKRVYKYGQSFYPAEVVPEPNNEYDPGALAVMVGGHKVGYVYRSDQEEIRNRMQLGQRSFIRVYCGPFKAVFSEDPNTDWANVNPDVISVKEVDDLVRVRLYFR